MKKKVFGILVAATMAMTAITGCGSSNDEAGFDSTNEITVVSREDGSGTRGAFVELVGIEEKEESGEKVDRTTDEANTTNSTSVMMTTVAGDEYAIGYISLGSLNDTVKAVKIDGVEATVENIKAGTYSIARPFNIATLGETTNAVAIDFMDYVMSADGQAIIEDNGYISIDAGESFESTLPKGELVIAGSSSVSPVMEKLVEAYQLLNDKAEIEIQTNDSTTGMTNTIDGLCDIGMASRQLKDSEIEAGLVGTAIAMDGIVVIVNNENTIKDLTKEQVMNIYIGETITWDEVQ